MKILLDENLPRKLQKMFDSTHEVKTVRDMAWKEKRRTIGIIDIGRI